MKILLVEDDRPTEQRIVSILKAHRYTVDLANDGLTGLELAVLKPYDLILLDVQIADVSGIRMCQQLRYHHVKTPILLLMENDNKDDIICGLDAGADGYVVKPLNGNYLLAQVRVLLRRNYAMPASPVLTWGELCLNPMSAQVTYQKAPLLLSSKEYKLLELFMRHPQQVFSRGTVLDRIWSVNDFPTENAVTNLVKDVRRKLKAGGLTEEIIETVHGLGYRLKAAPRVMPQETKSLAAMPLTAGR